jgi:hypothetical protein
MVTDLRLPTRQQPIYQIARWTTSLRHYLSDKDVIRPGEYERNCFAVVVVGSAELALDVQIRKSDPSKSVPFERGNDENGLCVWSP